MKRFGLLLLALACLHAGKVFRLIPLPGFLEKSPVIGYAHCETYTDIVRDRGFAAADQSPWGYDPYVAAGEKAGLGRNRISIAPVFFDRAVRGFTRPETSYRLFVFLALFSGPLLLFGAARLFGMAPMAALLSAVFLSSGMLAHDFYSEELIYQGNISGWFSAPVAIFGAACLYGFGLKRSRFSAAGFIISVMCLPALNLHLFMLQFIVWPVIALVAPPEARRRTGILLASGLLVTMAANSAWISIPRWITGGRRAGDWSGQGLTALGGLFLPMSGGWMDRLHATTRLYLLGFAVAQIILLQTEKRRLGRVILWTGVLYAVSGFFGRSLPLPFFERGPFIFAFTSLLLIPAGGFMSRAFLKPGTVRYVVFAWYVWFLFTWQLANRFDPAPLRTELSARERRLNDDIRKLPPDGRVLVQYGPLLTDGLRLAATRGLHYFAGFAGIGWTTAERVYGSFVPFERDWELLGYPLRSYDEDRFMERLRLFNVSSVVATTPQIRALFSGMSSLVPVVTDTEDTYTIFRVRNPARNGYIISGSGQLTATYGKIEIIGASSGTVVTAFLWSPGFRAVPPARARSFSPDGDSAEFLAIENPDPGATLTVTHGR